MYPDLPSGLGLSCWKTEEEIGLGDGSESSSGSRLCLNATQVGFWGALAMAEHSTGSASWKGRSRGQGGCTPAPFPFYACGHTLLSAFRAQGRCRQRPGSISLQALSICSFSCPCREGPALITNSRRCAEMRRYRADVRAGVRTATLLPRCS